MFFCFVGFICQFDFEVVNGVVWCAVACLLTWRDALRWNLWRFAVLEAVNWCCLVCSGLTVIFQLRGALKSEMKFVETCSSTWYFDVFFAVFAVCLVAVWQILSAASCWCVVWPGNFPSLFSLACPESRHDRPLVRPWISSRQPEGTLMLLE